MQYCNHDVRKTQHATAKAESFDRLCLVQGTLNDASPVQFMDSHKMHQVLNILQQQPCVVPVPDKVHSATLEYHTLNH